MKELIKKNGPFISVYLLLAAVIMILISLYGKEGTQLLANQYYSPFFDTFFFWSTKIVEWFSIVVITGILLFKGAKYAINGVLIFGITTLITFSLKRLVFPDAIRPTGIIKELRLIPSEFGLNQVVNNSFPSGHTTAGFTLFCFISLISVNKKLGFIYGFIALLIGYSRVYLSQHFFEDVLSGATIGTFFTLFLYYLFDKIKYGKWAYKPLIRKL